MHCGDGGGGGFTNPCRVLTFGHSFAGSVKLNQLEVVVVVAVAVAIQPPSNNNNDSND